VLGLHTRDHLQVRESAQVGIVQQLRVLDAAARTGSRECSQCNGIGSIADRMDGALEAGIRRAAHERAQLLEWDEQHTMFADAGA
jgi:hypothetical protein